MSKYVDKVEAYKNKILQSAIEKFEKKKNEAFWNFCDTGYDRYQKVIDRCEKEIDEINLYLTGKSMDYITVKRSDVDHLTEQAQLLRTLRRAIEFCIDYMPDCTQRRTLEKALADIKRTEKNEQFGKN